mgnify:CR=1 FL=1
MRALRSASFCFCKSCFSWFSACSFLIFISAILSSSVFVDAMWYILLSILYMKKRPMLFNMSRPYCEEGARFATHPFAYAGLSCSRCFW